VSTHRNHKVTSHAQYAPGNVCGQANGLHQGEAEVTTATIINRVE